MDEQARIEYEILELKNNTLNISVVATKIKKEYYIEMIMPPSLIDTQFYDREITFVINFQIDKYPIVPPKLFCTTVFCFPQIADGRDILANVLKEEWNEQRQLISLLELIPQFIREYYARGDLIFIGSYYLDEKYDIRLFEKCSFSIKHVKENIIIKGKWTKFPRLLLISDLYFCLFDQDKKNKTKLILVFWASINSIISIRKILVNKIVFIRWNQKDQNDPYEMNLTIDKGDEIVDQLLNNIKQFGMNYNVTKEIKGQPPKEISPEEYNASSNSNSNRYRNNMNMTGENEDNNDELNIEKLEEDIIQLEKALDTEQQNENTDNTEVMQALYNYYDQAEQYYKSVNGEGNNDKAKGYNDKKEQLVALFNNKNNNK